MIYPRPKGGVERKVSQAPDPINDGFGVKVRGDEVDMLSELFGG